MIIDLNLGYHKIFKNMNFKIIGNSKLTNSLVIDNWFNEREEKAIWSELNFYSALPKQYQTRTDDAQDVAKDNDGSSRAKCFRWYPSEHFNRNYSHISHILNCQRKVEEDNFKEAIDNLTPLNRMFYSSNHQDSMVTYYDNQDYYKPHYDTFFWTMCIWMLKDENKISGGDFVFSDTEEVVELKHNRAVFFPSFLLHEVKPITVLDDSDNYGKYTITNFFSYKFLDE